MFAKFKRQRHYIFIRFLISYMLILLIPLILMVFAYRECIGTIEQTIIDSNLAILRQTRDILDRRFNEIDGFINQIAWNQKIKKLLYLKGPLDDSIYTVRDTQRDISSLCITNSFVPDFYVYFKNSSIIISPYTSYIDLSLLYGQQFKFADMDFKQFYDKILNGNYYKNYIPSSLITLHGNQKNMITCIQSIPFEFPNDFVGNILFFIDESEIHKLLKNVNVQEGGWAYISDSKGNVITSIGGGKDKIRLIDSSYKDFTRYNADGRDMVVSKIISSYNGWEYVAVMPYDIVMIKVQYIRRIIWVFAFLTIFIGIVIAYLLAYKNSKPLKDTIAILKEAVGIFNDRIGNEYDFIHSSVSKLADSNKSLKQAMDEQIPILQIAFLDRLFKAGFNNIKELEALLSQARLEIRGSSFGVLLIRVHGYNGIINKDILEEMNMKKLVVNRVLKEAFGESCIPYDIEVDRIALLIWSDNHDNLKDYINMSAVRVFEILEKDYGIRVSFAAGSISGDIMDVCRSFDEAKQAMEYKFTYGNGNIVWYDKTMSENFRYYYPMDVETRLINLVKSGDKEEAKKLLKEIYTQNFSQRQLSCDMVKQLLYEVRGTLIKCIDQINIEDAEVCSGVKELVERLYRCGTMDEIYSNILKVYEAVCNVVNKRKKSHNFKLKQQIIDFINKNYNDADFCLCMVASYFDLTEAYLSQFFKEQTGENFSCYLERIRIQHAHELLRSTDLSIDEIAQRVGYNSAHAFRRAYKRVKGEIPTACRKKPKIENIIS